jgi:uncharacterized membrane protein
LADHMSQVVVLAFDNEIDAGRMRDDLLQMQREHLIDLEEAAVVVKDEKGKVKVNNEESVASSGALWGGFLGLLIGIIFFVPVFGLVVGAAAGAIAGKYGGAVDHQFIKDVGDTIKPGNSALFLLIKEATTDKVMDGLKKYKNVKILKTSLSKEQEEQLKQAFAK